MPTVNHCIPICSYNCRGWNSGKQFVSQLLDSHLICLVQEHWLLPDCLSLLNTSGSVLSTGVSGMDHFDFISGRPFGGCGIIYHNSLESVVSIIDCSAYKRFCAINCCFNDKHNLILVCVYFPTNYNTEASDARFNETLAELEAFLQTVSYDDLIISGDFNVDFRNKISRTEALKEFMLNYNLICSDEILTFHIHTAVTTAGLNLGLIIY